MVTVQRMKVANEKASKTVTMRGNVPKSSVTISKYAELDVLLTSF